MLSSVLSSLRYKPSNDMGELRRKHVRRDGDKCVCLIDNMPYPVENWSLGGVYIRADGRMFTVDQTVKMVLKFKVRGEMVSIPLDARVVRRGQNGVAVKFENVGTAMRHALQNIISDVITLQFAESQSGLA